MAYTGPREGTTGQSTTVTVGVGGVVRTVEARLLPDFDNDPDRTWPRRAMIDGVVATIGRGGARYPATLVLDRADPADPVARSRRTTVDAAGRTWAYHFGTIIRNRQATIGAWADLAPVTNASNQTRQAAR
jgi:hypothetical protein